MASKAWLSHLVPGHAPDGAPILSVLGKKTFRFADGKAAWEDEEQPPFVEADEYGGKGKPASDPVRLESDLAAYKPMTDVVVLAKAHAPGGRPVKLLDVGVQVGQARKIARVFGNRKAFVTATGLAFTDPEPFAEMDIDYSRAYGGQDAKSEEGVQYAYLRNPVGRGFVVKNSPRAVQDLPLPNIEDPQKLLAPQNLVVGSFDRWRLYPEPMGFGYVNKSFHPRFTLAGLPPDLWTQAEADRIQALKKAPEVGAKGSPPPPPVTPMLNPLFFNGASKGLALPYLRGDETVKLAHLDKDRPQFAFALPGRRPKAWLDVGEGRTGLAMVLHTVVVDMEAHRLSMVWRGCAYYGGVEAMKDFTALEYGVEEA